jgi:hypothetical protein
MACRCSFHKLSVWVSTKNRCAACMSSHEKAAHRQRTLNYEFCGSAKMYGTERMCNVINCRPTLSARCRQI